jgi:Chaperone of endosialidase
MKPKMTTLPVRNWISHAPLRGVFLLIPLGLVWFALSPTVQAQLPSPTPDGGYPGANTAEGLNALASLTTGIYNTAIGFDALLSNATGNFNTDTGFEALYSSATGGQNTAAGYQALQFNTIGSANTATGDSALFSNTTGNSNTAIGFDALLNNRTGEGNTADGQGALLQNTTGANNIALGASAGSNLATGSNNIDIGALGAAGESNTIRIGKAGVQKTAYMQGIRGATVASGVTVIVGTDGHLGTVVSSERFKEAIKPMDKASEAILALKPVTFRYKPELDPEGIPQFGLVAEQVEKVNPDPVARDADGKVHTVRYEAVNAMSLNEFLKEHCTVQELKSTVAKQDATIAALTASLKEQATQIQKVGAQLEVTRAAPQMVRNNQ